MYYSILIIILSTLIKQNILNILETVRSVQKHRNCTDHLVLKPMKFFMANAKFREEKKQKKNHSSF